MCIVVSEFQGGRGNQATRSRTEWECKTECFGTIEIEMCVLHVHYLTFLNRYGSLLPFKCFWAINIELLNVVQPDGNPQKSAETPKQKPQAKTPTKLQL